MGAFLPRFVSHVLRTHYNCNVQVFILAKHGTILSQKFSFSQYQNIYKSTKKL